MDEAEQLDARRAMAGENVDFSHYWMMMRFNQITSVLTLPTTSALDKRLKELADIWIEVQRRGRALVHKISVGSYENGKVRTPKIQELEWPNVADHDEMQRLDEMKQAKIDRQLQSIQQEDETEDPEDARRAAYIEVAQKWRDAGKSAVEIAEALPYTKDWVYKYTESPTDD
jgi:hypothetical protein